MKGFVEKSSFLIEFNGSDPSIQGFKNFATRHKIRYTAFENN
jgi:hypothetical protein